MRGAAQRQGAALRAAEFCESQAARRGLRTLPGLQICDQRLEELAWRLRFEESRSDSLIFRQAHECANANQIFVHQAFRHPDHKNQSGTLLICADWNAGAAASNADDDLIYQVGSRVREGNTVFHGARMLLFTCEDLLKRYFCIIYLSVLREYLTNLAYRIRQFSCA